MCSDLAVFQIRMSVSFSYYKPDYECFYYCAGCWKVKEKEWMDTYYLGTYDPEKGKYKCDWFKDKHVP